MSDSDAPNAVRRNRWTLALLVAIFVGPIVVAWLFAEGFLTPADSAMNRGELFDPAIDLRTSTEVDALFERAALEPGEWLVVYTAPGGCEDRCQDALERLEVIRSLLGYAGQRIRWFAITTAETSTFSSNHVLVDSRAYAALTASAVPDEGFLLLDWRRQLVERFAPAADSADIKRDLKKLLTASRIR